MKPEKGIEILLIVVSIACGLNAFISSTSSTHAYMEMTGRISLALLCVYYIFKLQKSIFVVPLLLLLLHTFYILAPYFDTPAESWIYYAGQAGFALFALIMLPEVLSKKVEYKDTGLFFYGLIGGLLFQVAFRNIPDDTDQFMKIALNINYLIVGMIGTIRLSPEKEPVYKNGVLQNLNVILVLSLVELIQSLN